MFNFSVRLVLIFCVICLLPTERSQAETQQLTLDDCINIALENNPQIEIARQQGYAVSKAENTPGAHSIAAPVFNAERKLVGALAISGPSIRMTHEQTQKWINVVVDTAKYLSTRLGNPNCSES